MRNTTHVLENLYDILSPELLGKISKNNTLSTLILTGDPYLSFFENQEELFSVTVIGAFQKNNTIKTIVFEKLSITSIQFLLPALGKIEKLILRNLSTDEIFLICNVLADYLPIAPEIILEHAPDDHLSHEKVQQFNQKRMNYFQAINPQKRDFAKSEIKGEYPQEKRQRIEENMDVEVNSHTMHLAILQNTQNHQTMLELKTKNLECFTKIKDAFNKCSSPILLDKTLNKKRNKDSNKIRTQFCTLAKTDNGQDFKKFLPMIEKKTKSKIFDLREHAILLAAEHGNRATLNQLLGGRIRMVVGEPTPENKEAVLSEREVLIIKRPSNNALKTANLAFKDKFGNYKEESIGRIKLPEFLFKSQKICTDVTTVTRFVKMLKKLEASQQFLRRTKLIQVNVLEKAFLLALQNGHLPLLYDILDYKNCFNPCDVFKPSITEENNFSNFLNCIACFAIQKNHVALFNQIIDIDFTFDEPSLKKIVVDCILHNKSPMLDCLFQHYYFSDDAINTYFQFAFHQNDTIDIQKYFLAEENIPSFNIGGKITPYKIYVIKDRADFPLIQKDEQTEVIPLYLIADQGYSLGLIVTDEYKEYQITNNKDLIYIENFLSANNQTEILLNHNLNTRFFRLLLLSFGEKFNFQLDPQKLANIANPNSVTLFCGTPAHLCSNLDNFDLLINNKNYDLSLHDNQFLRSIMQIHLSFTENTTETNLLKLRFGKMMVKLLEDERINPLLNDIPDFYVRGIKLIIEKGYENIIPIITQNKPENSLLLSQIFTKYPQIIKQALEIAVQQKHYKIIYELASGLDFSKLTPEELIKAKNVDQQFIAIRTKIANTTDPIEKENLLKEWKDIKESSQQISNKISHYATLNTQILTIFMSSPSLFNYNQPQQWENYLKHLQKEHVFFNKGLYDYVCGWPQMKEWRKVKEQHGFFSKSEPQVKINLPNEIVDLIEGHFLNVHRITPK